MATLSSGAGLLMLQPTPSVSRGRCPVTLADPRQSGGFNPRPPFPEGDADVTLPESAVIQDSTEREDRPFYDRVFIAGETAGGILADVRRSGKAGDALAPMEIDQLITAEAAARARGVSILAETGRGRTITLSIQLLPGTGVIDPGRYVRYSSWVSGCFGISRAVSVNYANGVLRQSVTLEVRE